MNQPPPTTTSTTGLYLMAAALSVVALSGLVVVSACSDTIEHNDWQTEECTADSDCNDDYNCEAGVCEPEESLNVGESENNQQSDGSQPKLPSLAFDDGCDPEGMDPHWTSPCDWIEHADAIVWGSIDEMTFHEQSDELPGPLLDECPYSELPGVITLTIDVDDVFRGDADDVVDVYLTSAKYSVWSPGPVCSEDDPTTPDWGETSETAEGVGPLEVGQPLGMALHEVDGLFVADDAVDPLFTERDDSLFIQPGNAFGCHNLLPDEFDALTIDGFESLVRSCGTDDPDAQCSYDAEFPCYEDCCPEDCSSHRGTVYDMENRCELEVGTWACSPSGAADAGMHWMCSMDGQYAVHAQGMPMDGSTPELTPCSNLADFQERDPDVDDFDECE